MQQTPYIIIYVYLKDKCKKEKKKKNKEKIRTRTDVRCEVMAKKENKNAGRIVLQLVLFSLPTLHFLVGTSPFTQPVNSLNQRKKNSRVAPASVVMVELVIIISGLPLLHPSPCAANGWQAPTKPIHKINH